MRKTEYIKKRASTISILLAATLFLLSLLTNTSSGDSDKAAEKQTTSINIKVPAVVTTIASFFTLHNPSEDEIDYRSIPGIGQPDDKAIIFAIADAKAGTMKKRGRKKTADAE